MARDPYRYFRIEARELLKQMAESALALEKSAAGPDAVAGILRLAHTLKGAARVVKQREIADQAHVIEDLLAPRRDLEEALSAAEVEAILQGIDVMSERVAGLDQNESTTLPEASLGPAPGGGVSLIKADVPAAMAIEDIDELLNALAEAGAECSRLRDDVDALAQVKQTIAAAELAWKRAREKPCATSDAAADAALSILRDALVARERRLADGVGQLNRELSGAQEAARRLRLRRAGDMFLTLEIAARDAARAVDRDVTFVASGQEERLDAKVFALMQQALLQAVRNAVAHGVETVEERVSSGKAATATIRIEVVPRGRRTLFTCRDDGRGIDLQAVREALAAKEMTLERVAAMTKSELLQCLLTNRISTSESVTQLSGRGIGLDVIREAADSLGGSVAIESQEGFGTALQFSIPVSVTAVDALMVESAGRMVAIPLRAVKQTLRIAGGELSRSPQGESLLLGGNVVPFIPLAHALRQVQAGEGARKACTAVIVARDGQLAALGIDRLGGTQNLIVKPLPDFALCDPIVAGASLDAEGKPQLMLDPEQLVDFARNTRPEAPVEPPQRVPVLVIDDSLTTRMLEQSILESAGYEVDVAVNAEEGLERAQARRYALILVDVEMPGMDGFTFVERVRADPVLKHVPTILVTSRSAPEDRERGIAAGANGYIVKGNFDQGELLASIRRLVRK